MEGRNGIALNGYVASFNSEETADWFLSQMKIMLSRREGK